MMQGALLFVLGGCATLIGQSLITKWGSTGQPTTVLVSPGLDLNKATAQELSQVPGLGPKRAQKIVDHRDSHGPYHSPDDVQQVKGIGGRTTDRFRKHVQIGPTSTTTHPTNKDAPPSARGKKTEPTEPIDLNTATRADLLQLPSIGPVLAQRILDHREEHGPFRDVKELLRIKGIKDKTLEKLLPYLRVGKEVVAAGS